MTTWVMWVRSSKRFGQNLCLRVRDPDGMGGRRVHCCLRGWPCLSPGAKATQSSCRKGQRKPGNNSPQYRWKHAPSCHRKNMITISPEMAQMAWNMRERRTVRRCTRAHFVFVSTKHQPRETVNQTPFKSDAGQSRPCHIH